MRVTFLGIVLFAFVAGLSLALLLVQQSHGETIRFKNGKILQGDVFDDEDDASMLKIVMGKGEMRVSRDLVERIEDASDDETSIEDLTTPMVFGESSGLQIMDKKFQNASSASVNTTTDGRPTFQAQADPVTSSGGNSWAFGSGDGQIKPLLAKVVQVRGQVEILGEGSNWRALEPNETLSPGMQIRTGNGRATLYTSDQVELRLTENAHLANLSETVIPTVRLESGKLWLKVHGVRDEKSGDPRIVILAPNAIAGVRGSLLFLDAETSETTTIAVFDGEVAVLEPETGSELLTLSADQATRIESPGQATSIRCESRWLEQWKFWGTWQTGAASEPSQ